VVGSSSTLKLDTEVGEDGVCTKDLTRTLVASLSSGDLLVTARSSSLSSQGSYQARVVGLFCFGCDLGFSRALALHDLQLQH
jgi:hypothetical protein